MLFVKKKIVKLIFDAVFISNFSYGLKCENRIMNTSSRNGVSLTDLHWMYSVEIRGVSPSQTTSKYYDITKKKPMMDSQAKPVGRRHC